MGVYHPVLKILTRLRMSFSTFVFRPTLLVTVSPLAWLLSLTKSFASLVSLVVGLFYTPQKRRTNINSYDFLKFNFDILLPSYFL